MTTTMREGREEVVLPSGFRAAGVAAGIKPSGSRDMALIVSDVPSSIAGVFTTNRICAAPVKLDRERLRHGIARAVVVNSGVANACTGEPGLRDARRTASLAARRLGVPEQEVFVCSTGRIGTRLPMEAVERGIESLVASLSDKGGEEAALAIMTTDTRPKRWTAEFSAGRRVARVTGLAKGAGMIEPNMATMLCFLLTDAAIERVALQRVLKEAADQSFNRITVDGDRSTNDTVLLLANGAAGGPVLRPGRPGWNAFEDMLFDTTLRLARMIVGDGEGATRVAVIRVRGARSDRDADLVARAVANSLLVKTAWAGSDANWGRVMDAVGYSGAHVIESKVDVDFEGLPAVRRGMAGSVTDASLRAAIAKPEFSVDIRLHLGRGEATVYTCNITEEYVRINM